jgi:hypothetical protein
VAERPSAEPAELAAAAAELKVLEAIRDALRGSAVNMAISNHVTEPVTLTDFPFAGAIRWLIPRQATGGRLAVEEAVQVRALEHNPSRIGGTIVNVGEKEVTLTLTDRLGAALPGQGQIGLVAGGGSWDLRLGNMLWCGSVAAAGVGGNSTLTVVEV